VQCRSRPSPAYRANRVPMRKAPAPCPTARFLP
jgi:hypothetical protein